MRVESFPPIAAPDAEILILGSMPGAASLAAGQYYAHPRNAFWPVMGALFGAGPELAYAQRVRALIAARVAVWDVLSACVRPGSLDADITEEAPNDFAAFFAAHPRIRRIGLNGGKAAAVFRRHGAAHMPAGAGMAVLPSTSPAHAALSLQAKQAAWRAGLLRLNS
ncbi:DNA-deoxyinosine glycosylase [Hyphomonas sp.]|uniref:DNA-deoxyinosine glycosylase n=1 Tax=Hyphomonas sp. TaxID=87 RepID=UPI00391A2082